MASIVNAEMPCEFHAFTNLTRLEREAQWRERIVLLLQQAFPGATVIDESEAA